MNNYIVCPEKRKTLKRWELSILVNLGLTQAKRNTNTCVHIKIQLKFRRKKQQAKHMQILQYTTEQYMMPMQQKTHASKQRK